MSGFGTHPYLQNIIQGAVHQKFAGGRQNFYCVLGRPILGCVRRLTQQTTLSVEKRRLYNLGQVRMK